MRREANILAMLLSQVGVPPSGHAGSRRSMLFLKIGHAVGQACRTVGQVGRRFGAQWEAGEAHHFNQNVDANCPSYSAHRRNLPPSDRETARELGALPPRFLPCVLAMRERRRVPLSRDPQGKLRVSQKLKPKVA